VSNFVFRRKEQKYLLTDGQRQAFIDLMAQYMKPDKYPRSSIRNIYYDTPDCRLIRRSLEKPVYKEKLRLRSYGDPVSGGDVFLEMKKKYKGVVYKRRVPMTVEAATAYMADPAARLEAGQIGREIDYFKDFYGQLRPSVYLSYQRLSWKGIGNDLRVTMDWDVCYRTDDLDLRLPPGGRDLLQPGEALVEIKSATAMPLWLVDFLSQQQIWQRSFSKYGKAYTILLTESRGLTHV
jgi:hypothetical protein